MLSEYETTRARNIERNNARLRELGLISRREERESNDSAWKRNTNNGEDGTTADAAARSDDGDDVDDEEYKEESPTVSKPRKRKRDHHQAKKKKEPSSPGRTSLRLQGLEPDGSVAATSSKSTEDVRLERQQRVRECREARLRVAAQYGNDELGLERAAKENPTATYEHCLMRVRTMKTPKALTNRIKAIERAAGKHCVVKMAIFKGCLQDEGMWELAESAGEALERLKALKPPPPTEQQQEQEE